MFAGLASLIAMICLLYVDPTISYRLTSMGMSENIVGVAFSLMGLSFGLGSPVAGWLCGWMSRRVVIQIGLFLLAGSCLLIGPS